MWSPAKGSRFAPLLDIEAERPVALPSEGDSSARSISIPEEPVIGEGSFAEPSSLVGNSENPGDPGAKDRTNGNEREVKVPRTVWFIICNEFCERYSYYGMRAILVLYLSDVLKLPDKLPTTLVHLFMMTAYFCPLLGAILSDSFFGKYRVILSLSCVYCIGQCMVSGSAGVAKMSSSGGLYLCVLGLLLISLGSGGIKPCVSAFGGDQIELSNPPGPARDRLLRWFFSYFYFSINVGSTLSMITVPLILDVVEPLGGKNLAYMAAFAAPAVLMFLALLIFWLGRRGYKHQSSSGNVVAEVLCVIGSAIWRAWFPSRNPPLPSQHSPDPLSLEAGVVGQDVENTSLPVVERENRRPAEGEGNDPSGNEETDPFVLRRGSRRAVLPEGHVAAPHWLDKAKERFGEERVEDVKQLLRVLLLFVPAPLFWALFDQQPTSWTLQANRMDGDLPFGFHILADQMQTLNAVGILIMIPLFNQVLYPLAEWVGLSLRPLARMCIGMVVCGISFFVAALVEVWVEKCPVQPANPSLGMGSPIHLGGRFQPMALGLNPRMLLVANKTMLLGATPDVGAGVALSAGAPAPMPSCKTVPMLWQVPQYVLITAAEIMFSITGLELAYSQSPAMMTSVVAAAWLVTDALGNLLTVVVIDTSTKSLSQVLEFQIFGLLCIVAMFLLHWLGRGFTYLESSDE